MANQTTPSQSVRTTAFTFINKAGGTGVSNAAWNPKPFNAIATILVVRVWDDSETGLHFMGTSENDPAVKAYLEENAGDDHHLFVSEFELVGDGATALSSFIAFVQHKVTKVQTPDGYTFEKTVDGWSDGDMTFDNLQDMFEATGGLTIVEMDAK